jgi:hypothetical protein
MPLRTTTARFLSLAIGTLLIVPLAFVAEQEIFVLRRSDVVNGLRPLLAIPLGSMRNSSSLSREVVIPSDHGWQRMTSFYGQPKFLISVVNVPLGSAGFGRRAYTYEEVGLRVKVFRASSEVPLEPTNAPPYGYSSERPSSGWLFKATAGERVSLVIERPAFRSGTTRGPPGQREARDVQRRRIPAGRHHSLERSVATTGGGPTPTRIAVRCYQYSYERRPDDRHS